MSYAFLYAIAECEHTCEVKELNADNVARLCFVHQNLQ